MEAIRSITGPLSNEFYKNKLEQTSWWCVWRKWKHINSGERRGESCGQGWGRI